MPAAVMILIQIQRMGAEFASSQIRVSIGFFFCSLFPIQSDLSNVQCVRIPNLTLSLGLSLAGLLRRLTEETVGFSIVIEDLQTP